jgi:hypothetical protein
MSTRDEDLQAKFYMGIMGLLMALATHLWVNGGVRETLREMPDLVTPAEPESN